MSPYKSTAISKQLNKWKEKSKYKKKYMLEIISQGTKGFTEKTKLTDKLQQND